MTGRHALLLVALLALGGIAQADDNPSAPPDAPKTATPDTPPTAPAPAVPGQTRDQPVPASPEPDAPSASAPADAPKDAAPSDAPKEAPPPDPVKPPPKDVAQPPKNLEPIPKDTVLSVLGKKVLGPDGEDMGRVTDLLLDRDAHITSIVIDFGGFLGVGSRKIAIDWRLVRFVPDKPDAPIALSLGKAEVQAAPEYKDSAQPPVMVGPPPTGSDAAR